MGILINAHEITKSFGARPLFEKISFAIQDGERVGLIGPNGAGKSTLLKILAGKVAPDAGTLSIQRGLKISYLDQVPTFSKPNILQTVMEGAKDPDDWDEMARALEILSKLSVENPEALIADLSGGWKKRVALARELMRDPDLLLLDEPTNHLDVESIEWLENFISTSRYATLTITHDRAFLQAVSNRILELDRRNIGGLLSIKGDYATYLQTKEDLMRAQESQETKLRNTLRREVEWLSRGPKARTTKQQARIDRAGDLKDAVSELGYRNQSLNLKIDFLGAEKNPKKLIEAKGISKSYEGNSIVPKIDLVITPKSRVALLGSNGCGKSTLIRLLVKTETPDTGEVIHADQLKINYFEQHRDSLNPETTLVKSICPNGDYVDYQGARVHVNGYLDRFLFKPEQREMPVGRLSGGEQSRILIAKLMLMEANLLVLDEPTNDLDLATLDILAEVLQEFKGAVILVTHDRYFLDQVSKQILAFETNSSGKKEIISFANLEQWENYRERAKSAPAPKKQEKVAEKPKEKMKLSFKEQLELDGMEEKIKAAEEKLSALEKESVEHASNASALTKLTKEMSELQTQIDKLYQRWSQLEAYSKS